MLGPEPVAPADVGAAGAALPGAPSGWLAEALGEALLDDDEAPDFDWVPGALVLLHADSPAASSSESITIAVRFMVIDSIEL